MSWENGFPGGGGGKTTPFTGVAQSAIGAKAKVSCSVVRGIPTKLPDPAVMPGTSGTGVAFSPDGVYMVVVSENSPYLTIYKRSGDTFTKLANPVVMPSGACRGVAFSPDGVYMALACDSSLLMIYKRSGDTFTKLAGPTTSPMGPVYAVAFSPNGTYLAVGSNTSSSEGVYVYKRSGDTFTKLSTPTMSTYYTYIKNLAFSADSIYLVTARGSNSMLMWKRSGDTFSALNSPITVPSSGNSSDVVISPDGIYLAIACTPGNSADLRKLMVYKWNGTTWEKETAPNAQPSWEPYSVTFSSDGKLMAASCYGAVLVFAHNGDAFIKLDGPSTMPSGNARDVEFSSDGTYMVVVGDSPMIIYKAAAETNAVQLSAPWERNPQRYQDDVVGYGLAKAAANSGASVTVDMSYTF